MAQKERRTNPDAKTRDRRYVSRLTNPDMRECAQQVQLLVMALFWLVIVGTSALLIEGLIVSSDTLLRNAALSIVAGLFAAILFSYAKALKAYIKLETPGTLAICFERQRNFWTLLTFTFIATILFAILFNL